MRTITTLLTVFVISFAAQAEDFSSIQSTVKKLQPTAKITAIEPTVVPTLYEVRMEDFEPIYITKDGKHFLMGTLLEMSDTGKVINHTQEKLRAERQQLISKIPAKDMIVFSPSGASKRIIYVFTDVDCGYCRKFHTEISDFNQMGIEVRYLAYPRGGTDAESFKKMQSVWCSKDRKRALTKVKAGGDVEELNCNNPVAGQYRLGLAMSVQGTPSVFTENGEQIGGYLTPEQMKKALGL